MGGNAAKLRDLYDAFAKGDMQTVMASMDPKIDWREPEGLPLEDQVGPDAVLQNIFAVLPTVYREFSVDVAEVLDAGDDVVLAVGVYRGVGQETGKTLAAHFAHVWRIGADGKITGFRTYTDTHLWREVLGTNEREQATSGAAPQ